MPGISLIKSLSNYNNFNTPKFLKCKNSLLFNQNYSLKEYINFPNIKLFSTSYKNYPIKKFVYDEFDIIIEGEIYNQLDNYETHLKNLLNNLLKNNFEKIKDWLFNSDGEFIIVIVNKNSKKIFILNDLLGRLPFYIFKSEQQIILSREIKFLINFSDNIKFDEIGAAQYLMFNHNFGNRTLFKDVKKLSPASLLILEDEEYEIKNIFRYNFDETYSTNKSFPYEQKLKDLLYQSCRSRFSNESENILSLSGGLDSRTIAAVLDNLKINYLNISYLDYQKKAFNDVLIAEKISKTLNKKWEIINLSHESSELLLKLLDMKLGMNSLELSFLIDYLEKVNLSYSSEINFVTGDGGDKIFPSLNPGVKIKDADQFLNFVIRNRQVFKIKELQQIINFDEQDFLHELSLNFSNYPENNYNNKFKHLMIYERGVNWLFEGEDRNRYYFWQVSPFYSIPLFNYAIKIPDNIKSNFYLFKKLLLELNPRLAEIENALWNFSLMNKKVELLSIFKDKIYSNLPFFFRRYINDRINSSNRVLPLETMKGRFIVKYFKDFNALKIAEDNFENQKISELQLNLIFTLFAVYDKISSDGSNLIKHLELEKK